VKEGSVLGHDGLDPAGFIFSQAAVASFIGAGPAFVGAEPAACSRRIPRRSFRKTELFPGGFVDTQRDRALWKRAKTVRAHSDDSGGRFNLAD